MLIDWDNIFNGKKKLKEIMFIEETILKENDKEKLDDLIDRKYLVNYLKWKDYKTYCKPLQVK